MSLIIAGDGQDLLSEILNGYNAKFKIPLNNTHTSFGIIYTFLKRKFGVILKL